MQAKLAGRLPMEHASGLFDPGPTGPGPLVPGPSVPGPPVPESAEY